MNVEKEAAEALLDDGVSVPFKEIRIPFTGRRIKLRMTMRRPCLGSQIRIAKYYLSLGATYEQMKAFTLEEEMAFVARHGATISRMIALTVCRGAVSGRLLAPVVAYFIRWFVPDVFIQGANMEFLTLLGTRNFMNIIRSAEETNPMRPRLSQKTRNGS